MASVIVYAATLNGCVVSPEGFDDPDMVSTSEQEILGGTNAPAGAWPSAVAFIHPLVPPTACGGSLIHPKWVLTAAHCVIWDGIPIPASEFKAIIGREVLTAAGGVERTPVRTIPHPSFNLATGAYDIALVELNSAVSYRTTEWMTPGEFAANKVPELATAVGWGLTTPFWQAEAPPLQQVNLPFQGSGSACNTYYTPRSIHSSLACLGPLDGSKDACPGDSGSGTYALVGGLWKQHSIVSGGGLNLFEQCGVAGRPGLYSMPSTATSFLRSNLPSTEGRLVVQLADGTGAFTAGTTKTGQSSRFDIVVSGQFKSTATADLVTYDSAGGEIRLFTSDAAGAFTASAAQVNFSKNYSLIQAGRVTTDAFDDLVVYDPVAGSLRAYANNGAGSFAALGNARTDVGSGVGTMTVGNFDGDSNLDILLYTPTTGTGKFYEVSSAGAISLVRTDTGWDKTWEMIVPGDFGPAATTDLLFYSPTKGLARFYSVGTGVFDTLIKEHSWNKDWQFIVPGQFDGAGSTDLFFYNPRSGLTKTFKTDGAGGIVLLKETTWKKTWVQIVAGNVASTSHTDLILYDRWVRP